MKEKRKSEPTSLKKKKNKKKDKRKQDSTSETSSSDENMQWVDASVPSLDKKIKKHKKKHKKMYDSSDESDSSSKLEWVEASSEKNAKVKKKKKKKKKYSSSSTSSDSSGNENLETMSDLPSSSHEKRESWMNEELFVPTLSKDEMYLSSRQKRIDSKKQQREEEEKVQRERELNPHLKNEGTGLPIKETNVESLSLPSTSVGDGGYSWLKKAYYRIQEQAQCEGRSMEEVAVERWGSLSKLTSLIEEAEARMKNHPDFKKSEKESYHRYNQDRRYNASRFKKPSESSESERNFDSAFQFKKPTNDYKRNKKLNEFKSVRKSNYEEYNRSENMHKEKIDSTGQHKSYKSENENRIPAWKKPKQLCETSEKKISVCSETLVSSLPNETDAKMKSEENKTPVVYSDDDISKLAAKQLKAELMGDIQLAEKLKKQLEEVREIVKEKGFAKQPSKKVEEVILTKFDSQGLSRPIQASQERVESYKQKKSNKLFDDGSRHSLKEMFEREKLTTSDDHMEMFVEATVNSNETAEIDYESGHISKKLSKKLSATRQEERDIGKAIQQHQKLNASLEKCEYCLDQPRMKKYLIVDIGEQVYLCLPNFQTLTDGHCLIVPKTHVPSFLSLDENDWKEVNDFKNQLRNLFRSDNKSVLFLETSMNYRYFPHSILECIPVPKEESEMAPFYFKKAIQESESEWAHNKKLVDLTKKGLRYSIPKGLPYFHVEFDPEVHAGYAHVIEDEKYFPRNFGKEVIGGMLDIDYNYLYKNKREDPLKKSKDVAEFEKRWTKFKNTS